MSLLNFVGTQTCCAQRVHHPSGVGVTTEWVRLPFMGMTAEPVKQPGFVGDNLPLRQFVELLITRR